MCSAMILISWAHAKRSCTGWRKLEVQPSAFPLIFLIFPILRFSVTSICPITSLEAALVLCLTHLSFLQPFLLRPSLQLHHVHEGSQLSRSLDILQLYFKVIGPFEDVSLLIQVASSLLRPLFSESRSHPQPGVSLGHMGATWGLTEIEMYVNHGVYYCKTFFQISCYSS